MKRIITITCFAIGLSAVLLNQAHGQRKRENTKIGFEATAGSQSFQLASNVASLNQANINQLGGGLGFNVSGDFWKAKLKPIGFYHSNSESQTSVKLKESGGLINLYPIKLIMGKESKLPTLYVTGGIMRGKYKINGTYLPEGETSDCVYDSETFSGDVISWNLTGGAGIEYELNFDAGSITLFGEIKKGLAAGSSSNLDLFKNTTIKNITTINVGFSINIGQ